MRRGRGTSHRRHSTQRPPRSAQAAALARAPAAPGRASSRPAPRQPQRPRQRTADRLSAPAGSSWLPWIVKMGRPTRMWGSRKLAVLRVHSGCTAISSQLPARAGGGRRCAAARPAAGWRRRGRRRAGGRGRRAGRAHWRGRAGGAAAAAAASSCASGPRAAAGAPSSRAAAGGSSAARPPEARHSWHAPAGARACAAAQRRRGALADEVLRGVHQQLELVLALEEAVLADQLDGAHDGGAAGLVLVEEVAGQQDEVDVVRHRQLQHLLEGAERVLLPDLILLPDALRRDGAGWGGGAVRPAGCPCYAGPGASCGGAGRRDERHAHQVVVRGHQHLQVAAAGAGVAMSGAREARIEAQRARRAAGRSRIVVAGHSRRRRGAGARPAGAEAAASGRGRCAARGRPLGAIRRLTEAQAIAVRAGRADGGRGVTAMKRRRWSRGPR
jgi:hypothetical protein